MFTVTSATQAQTQTHTGGTFLPPSVLPVLSSTNTFFHLSIHLSSLPGLLYPSPPSSFSSSPHFFNHSLLSLNASVSLSCSPPLHSTSFSPSLLSSTSLFISPTRWLCVVWWRLAGRVAEGGNCRHGLNRGRLWGEGRSGKDRDGGKTDKRDCTNQHSYTTTEQQHQCKMTICIHKKAHSGILTEACVSVNQCDRTQWSFEVLNLQRHSLHIVLKGINLKTASSAIKQQRLQNTKK